MGIKRGVLLYAGASMAAGRMSTATSPSVDIVAPGVVPKTVSSDTFRFVFVAGLEGAGHHYILGADTDMFIANPDLAYINEGDYLSEDPYYLPSCMSKNVSYYPKAEAQALQQMHRLAKVASILPPPGTVYVQHKSLSYPARSGVDKVFQYVDLRRMVEVAEEAGVDMRVLYLRRSAREIVIANTVHRPFHKKLCISSPEECFLKYMRVLFTDMAVLQSFLGEIDPEFVVCHDWKRMGEQEQASKIARFMAPNDDVAGLMESSLIHVAHRAQAQPEPLPFDGLDSLVMRLQRKLDAFETIYCD